MQPQETDVEWLICVGKKAFRSQAEAKRHARKYQARWGRQWAYRCPCAHHWHLTSKNPNRQAEHVQDNKTNNV